MNEYIVTVESNPNYCGEGAGGAQFAHGQARITDKWLAEWFRSHEGYTVEDVATETAEPEAAAPEAEESAAETAKPAKAAKSATK